MGRHSSSGEAERERNLMGILVAIGVVLIVFAAYWLMFRPSGPSAERGSSEGGGVIVGEVSGLPASEEYVGLILADNAEIAEVLARHGLPGAIPTGGSTFVVDVGKASTEDVIDELLDDPDVHDAGRVFDRPDSAEATTAP